MPVKNRDCFVPGTYLTLVVASLSSAPNGLTNGFPMGPCHPAQTLAPNTFCSASSCLSHFFASTISPNSARPPTWTHESSFKGYPPASLTTNLATILREGIRSMTPRSSLAAELGLSALGITPLQKTLSSTSTKPIYICRRSFVQWQNQFVAVHT